METAVNDVLNVIRYDDLEDIVLVGTASRGRWWQLWRTVHPRG